MAATRKSKRRNVSSGNPCPFLRALVAKVARAGEGQPHVPQAVARLGRLTEALN
jgi:hypothetical protein